jgi:hypothetical protein
MDRGEGFKEVCALYGAAMYYAQVLEHGIVNALVFLDLAPSTGGKYTPEQHEAYYNQQFEKTLGHLIQTLKRVSILPSELEAALSQSKAKRAYLAHHFFRDRLEAYTSGDVAPVLVELEEYRAFFETTDKALEVFLQPVMRRVGYTEEVIAELTANYTRTAGNAP